MLRRLNKIIIALWTIKKFWQSYLVESYVIKIVDKKIPSASEVYIAAKTKDFTETI